MARHPLLWCAVLTLSLILDLGTLAASLDDWRTRTIYQVLTDRFARSDNSKEECNVVGGQYCGGSWKGIEENLDYIQGMGFDAIWISPVVAQLPQSTIDGEAYTAYWAQDLYALNPRFGTEDDLRSLVKAAHSRHMYIMLDVVVNHMGYAGTGWDIGYSVLNPFNDRKYYHDYCSVYDTHNQTNVEKCWLGDDIVALADLRTEDNEVRDMFGKWISGMIKNYTFDGLRIDTTINVEPDFFEGFVKAAGVFATGETLNGDNKFVCSWATNIGSILNYPIYFTLTRAFASTEGSINDLVTTIYTMKDNCADPTGFGSFSENHDVERFPSMNQDMSLAKNIIAYTILGDGIPIIYQGQEQHMSGGTSPYTNRAPLWSAGYNASAELYKHISTLIKARQHFLKTSQDYARYISDVPFQDLHSFAMLKGHNGSQAITILTNTGSMQSKYEAHIDGLDYPPGTEMTEILTCTPLIINQTGTLNVPMSQGHPKVIYPTELMTGSGLCGHDEVKPMPMPTGGMPMPSGLPSDLPTAAGSSAASSNTAASPTSTRLALGSASAARQTSIRDIFLVVATTSLFASSGIGLMF